MIQRGIPFQKNIYMAFLGHLLCPSLDKANMESVYPVCQQATVDSFPWMAVRVREAEYGMGGSFMIFMGAW